MDVSPLNVRGDLVDVCPYDCPDSPQAGVEAGQQEGDQDGQVHLTEESHKPLPVHLNTSDLGQGQAGGVHYYGQVQAGQDDETGGDKQIKGMTMPRNP